MQNPTKLTVISTQSGVPVSVKFNNRNFQVIKILEFWRARTRWWRTGAITEQKVWRVVANSAQNEIIIEICYDPELEQWQLIRKLS